MNKITAALLTCLVAQTASAAFPDDPTVIHEGATLMTINDSRKPAVLMYPCPSCTPLKLFLDADTQIFINGSPADIPGLMQQPRWRADIFLNGAGATSIQMIRTY